MLLLNRVGHSNFFKSDDKRSNMKLDSKHYYRIALLVLGSCTYRHFSNCQQYSDYQTSKTEPDMPSTSHSQYEMLNLNIDFNLMVTLVTQVCLQT